MERNTIPVLQFILTHCGVHWILSTQEDGGIAVSIIFVFREIVSLRTCAIVGAKKKYLMSFVKETSPAGSRCL